MNALFFLCFCIVFGRRMEKKWSWSHTFSRGHAWLFAAVVKLRISEHHALVGPACSMRPRGQRGASPAAIIGGPRGAKCAYRYIGGQGPRGQAIAK